jgi:hypothetical protein
MASGLPADTSAVNQPERDHRRGRLDRAPRTRLAKLTLGLVLADVALSAGELIRVGELTPPVIALDIVGGTLLAFSLAARLILEGPSGENPQADDDDTGGGGGPDDEGQPHLPSGGLEIDWPRFEEEFRAYAHGLGLIAG